MRLVRGQPGERGRGDGPVKVLVHGKLAETIRDLSLAARSASAASWCVEVLEWFVMEHRSGKVRPDPARHDARNDWESVG